MRRENGFTLPELMIALAASVLLIGGILAVYLMSIRCWRDGSVDVGLERTGGIIMEKIVRGVSGRFGVREANIGTVQVSEGGDSVTFMVDKHDPPTSWNSDDVTSRYYLLGTQVMYDPDTSIAGDELPLNRFGDVQELNFSLSGHVLTASLTLAADTPGAMSRTLVGRVQTDVFFRKRR